MDITRESLLAGKAYLWPLFASLITSLSKSVTLGEYSEDTPDGYAIGDTPLDCELADSLSPADFDRMEREAKRRFRPVSEFEAHCMTEDDSELGIELNTYWTTGGNEESDEINWVRCGTEKLAFKSTADDERQTIEVSALYQHERNRRASERKMVTFTEKDFEVARWRMSELQRRIAYRRLLHRIAKASAKDLRKRDVKDWYWRKLKASRAECAKSDDWSQVWLTKEQADLIWAAWKRKTK